MPTVINGHRMSAGQGVELALLTQCGLRSSSKAAVRGAIQQPLVSRGPYSGQFLRSVIYAGKDRLLSQIVPSAHGTMTLNLNDVETFKVACPSDSKEAMDIVSVFAALDRKIDLHQQKRAVLEALFKALLHKLMTGEIAVDELDLSALDRAAVPEGAPA